MNNTDIIDFKQILFSLLKEYNLTQTQFANITGIKQSQVSEWLKGKAKPGYDNLRIISIKLDIPANVLLGIDD